MTSTSQRIAAVLGPTLIVATTSEVINLHIWAQVDPALVYLNGLFLLVAGLDSGWVSDSSRRRGADVFPFRTAAGTRAADLHSDRINRCLRDCSLCSRFFQAPHDRSNVDFSDTFERKAHRGTLPLQRPSSF